MDTLNCLPQLGQVSCLKAKSISPWTKTSKSLGCQRLAGAGLLIMPTTRFFIKWTGLHLPPHGKVRLGGCRQHPQHTWPWLSSAPVSRPLYIFLSPLSPLLSFCALSKHLSTSSRLPAAISGLGPRPSWGGEVPLASCQKHVPAD